MYLVLNFKSHLGTYEHDLLAYERDARGCKFAPGVNLLPRANLHPGSNCAHEHRLRLHSERHLKFVDICMTFYEYHFTFLVQERTRVYDGRPKSICLLGTRFIIHNNGNHPPNERQILDIKLLFKSMGFALPTYEKRHEKILLLHTQEVADQLSNHSGGSAHLFFGAWFEESTMFLNPLINKKNYNIFHHIIIGGFIDVYIVMRFVWF